MSLLRFRQISGSIITTASLTPGSLNSIRFVKVEGDTYTTYDLLIDTGSGGGGGVTNPSPPEYGIQYNSASAFKAESDFLYIYPSHSLQHGSATLTPGQYAHSEGKSTMAKGNFSHAEGQNTLASQSAAHSEGYYTTASAQYAHSEGRFALASGIGSHAEGSGSIALGASSHAEGELCISSETGSHAEGYFTTASGKYSHAEGGMVTLKTGTKVYTVASGLYSHAEGMASTASGQAAHAEGEQNTAGGVASHAEGFVVQAMGQYSHAEGTYTITSGTYSHAEGGYTTTIGTGSHAEGYFTVAVGNYQHTQGTYNITSSADYAFIIGNGTAEPARSNLIFASASNFEVSGTLLVTGSGHKIQGLTSQSQNYVLTYDDLTGQIYYTGSTNVGGGGGSGITELTGDVTAGPGSGTQAATLKGNLKSGSFGITLDGQGGVVTTGDKGYIAIPYDCTIKNWVLLADQVGSIQIDLRKDTYANFPPTIADTICGASNYPTLSSVQKNTDATLTGWTTTVTAGDIILFNVVSATTVTRVNLIVNVVKT